MNEEKLRVALIWGGQGRERGVSEKGKEHILPLINENTHDLLSIFIDPKGRWLLEDREVVPHQKGFLCPEDGRHYPVDCAFPLLHGDFGEDGIVQGALECAGIPYVGCDVAAGAVCRDKALVKAVAQSLGVPTLPYLVAFREEGVAYALRHAEEELCYPMFVKPTSLGSSVGVAAADTKDELRSALEGAFALSRKVIIEPRLIHKRELECGYFSTKGKEIFTNPGEILCEGLYGYKEKYTPGCARVAVRAELSDDLCQRVRDHSRAMVRQLGIRDLARVDFFLSEGEIYLNEINTMPGFTDGSLYAAMIGGHGICESRLIELLISGAVARG